ncbi:hypothetical protein CVT25_004788 [Psilocybe cyanescens]|uniref:Uncharacterized protein n=1 Tax=Psilocybe cyanescens TaxID=93625 RepID=A0A409XGJ9_PSICY|nr:hypothetical protein CVT25_004788 [Psilocybe cyanescens]
MNIFTSFDLHIITKPYGERETEIKRFKYDSAGVEFLVSQAHKIIADSSQHNFPGRYVYDDDDTYEVQGRMDLAEVVNSVLLHVKGYGGEQGLLYIASIIVACNTKASRSRIDVDHLHVTSLSVGSFCPSFAFASDKCLSCYEDPHRTRHSVDSHSSVRCWDDLVERRQHVLIRSSLEDALMSVKIH